MKGRQIALDEIAGRKAAALLVDGQLEDFLIDLPDNGAPAPGAIFRAIADRPMKGQGGMTLRLPDGASAFLRQSNTLRPGEPLLVQVTGLAEGGKAVPVTTRILFKSRYAIVTPDAPGINVARSIRDDDTRDRLQGIADTAMAGAGMGLIVRSAAADATPAVLGADIAAMRDMAAKIIADRKGSAPELLLDAPDAHMLAWRDWAEPAPDDVVERQGAFAALGVLDALDGLRRAQVALRGGGHIYVEPTRALVAVDVNTGGDTSPAAGLKANLDCARDLPRQLRLRGLGGQITIDFAPMPKKDRRTLEVALKAAFRGDAVDTTLVGWTPLGHFELQRKRERPPLAEVLPA